MRQLILIVSSLVLFACASDADKQQKQAAHEQMERQQISTELKKIQIQCRDRYPMGSPGALMKRKQCQEMGVNTMPVPK